ncbi:hypothetical protein Tco_1086924 [Tanacetum coccineum]
MASESSSQQPKQVIHASNVGLECDKDLVAKLTQWHNEGKRERIFYFTIYLSLSLNTYGLIPHYAKVAKISTALKKEDFCILSTKEVNTRNSADMSLSGTSIGHRCATKSLEASGLVEKLRNQPKPANAEKGEVVYSVSLSMVCVKYSAYIRRIVADFSLVPERIITKT